MREQPNRPLNDKGQPQCQARVTYYIGNWPHGKQCDYRAKVGEFCKIHDPKKIEQKAAERDAIAAEKWKHRRKEIHGSTFFKALEKIAEGHNDPRGLATEVLEKFHEGG